MNYFAELINLELDYQREERTIKIKLFLLL